VRIHFYEPPAAEAAGGLDLAIRSLERYLESAGVDLHLDTPLGELGNGAKTLVHFHGLWQPKHLRIAAHCRRERIPYVVSPHGMLEPWAFRHKAWKKWPWFHLFERRYLEGAARLLTTSESEAGHLARFFPREHCVALPLGVASDHEPDYLAARQALGWDESQTVFLFLSRLHPKKGLHLLLRSLVHLEPADRARVRLAIVGGGDEGYVRELKAFAERERARLPQVEWVGERWDATKWPYFQGADLFCLPSYSENFGLAVLEALQVGTRVLTTTQTPWSELSAWGGGFVVAPDVEPLRLAIAAFLGFPKWTLAERAKLAAEAHRRFSWSAVGPLYVRFYESVLMRQ
jgi:glycosyltransferase involved in cell wall biosynthesis